MKTARQLINLYKQAEFSHIKAGMRWYKEASDFARSLSSSHGIDYAKACGVISALSPANEWENNKREAEAICFAYANDLDYTIQNFRTYLNNVGKAISIISLSSTCDTLEKEVAEILFGKVGYKTHAFYWNILLPNLDIAVTIDRHMLALMEAGDYIKSAKHYRECSEVVIEAAKKLNILPHELQAVLWVWWIEKK